MRNLILAIVATAVCVNFVTCRKHKEESPSNIIFIFPDQHRNYSLGLCSQTGHAKYLQGKPDPVFTPAFERSANKGVVFNRAVSLDELGLAKNTIIIFTSDHWEMLGSHGRQERNVPEIEAFNITFLIKWEDKLKHRVENLIRGIHMHDLQNQYRCLEFLKLLRELGYKGYCNTEVDRSQEPITLMRYYRTLFMVPMQFNITI